MNDSVRVAITHDTDVRVNPRIVSVVSVEIEAHWPEKASRDEVNAALTKAVRQATRKIAEKTFS